MRYLPLAPNHVGDYAGDSAVYHVDGIYLRRLADSTLVVTLNLSSGHRLALYGEDAAPLLRAWSGNFAQWLGHCVRVRLRRDAACPASLAPENLEPPLAVEAEQDSTAVTQ